MGDDQGEAVFNAAKLLQPFDETEGVEAVTKVPRRSSRPPSTSAGSPGSFLPG